MELLPTEVFSLRLVYLTTMLKNLIQKSHLFFLVHTKHPLMHHLLQNHHHYTVNKLKELKI